MAPVSGRDMRVKRTRIAVEAPSASRPSNPCATKSITAQLRRPGDRDTQSRRRDGTGGVGDRLVMLGGSTVLLVGIGWLLKSDCCC